MKTSFAEEEQARFTWQRCFWLCLPALVIGAILRLSFLIAVPESYYGNDSNSYFVSAHSVILDHRFDFPPKRRFIYPLLLIPTPLVPFCNAVQFVAVAQHTLGLLMIYGIGWVTGHLMRRPGLWVPPVTILASMWPRMLYFEHEMVGECLMLGAFIATVAVAVPPEGLKTDKRLIWFCYLALLIMAIKPAGRPLWFALMIIAALYTRRPFSWPKICYATIPLAGIMTFTSGGDGQGPWLFLSSTLPLVKTEGEMYAKERAILKPAIEKARADLPNYAFRQGIYKKWLSNNHADGPLGAEYAAFASDRPYFSKVANHLGKEAVLSNPFLYLKMVGMKVISASSDRHNDQRLIPSFFWSEQKLSSAGRWQKLGDAKREKVGAEMRLLYEMDETSYNAMVEERSQRTVWYQSLVRPWLKVNWLQAGPGEVGQPPRIQLQWMGYLALFGLATALWPGRRFIKTSIIWFPTLLYMMIVFAVGDAVTRYLEPIDWTIFVLMAYGLDTLVEGIIVLWKRIRPAALTPEDELEEAKA